MRPLNDRSGEEMRHNGGQLPTSAHNQHIHQTQVTTLDTTTSLIRANE